VRSVLQDCDKWHRTIAVEYEFIATELTETDKRNSLFCCTRFGVRLSAIAHINKSFVWAHYQSQLTVSYRRTVYLLLELLFVKFGSLSVSCLSQADITYAIDSICMY